MNVAKSLEISVREGSTLLRIKERLPTYFSDFKEDPKWLLMFVFARTMLGRRMHWLLPRSKQKIAVVAQSMFTAQKSSVVHALRTDGIFQDLTLPQSINSEILKFAETTPCFGNHDRRLDLLPAAHIARQSAATVVTSGHYFERTESCAAVMAVQADPLLHGVAEEYLGAGSRVISTRLWWSFAPTGEGAGKSKLREMMHFDLDDWRMLKFFFYLTPVDVESGPHLYLRGSHRRHVLKHQLSLTVSRPLTEVRDVYGKDCLATIFGPSGSGFAEDPFGYHAGSLARATPRLMLEIGFGVSPPNRRRFYGERVLAPNPALTKVTN